MNFVSARCAKKLGLSIASARKDDQTADSSKLSKVIGLIKTTTSLHNQTYQRCLVIRVKIIGW